MKNLLYIGNKLSSHGKNITLLETLGKNLENEKYTIFYASSKKNKILRMLDMVFKTIKHAKKVDYVLIDTYSTTNFWYAFITSQLCRFFGTKYIPILHGGNLPNRIERSKKISKMIFNNSYVNVAPSRYLIEAFKKQGYDNCIYIPNSIHLKEYKFEKRDFDFPRLFWLRSFSKIYNPILAVKVFLKIKQLYPKATLCMVGPILDKSYLETKNFAQQNKIEVTFTGKLLKKDWIELSKEYNVFINTTHFDNTPISVIEAMALGLPVVSTNVGGISHFLKNEFNALLVPDNVIDQMTNQIIRLFTESDLANTITKNATNTINDFDWKIVKNQWINLLQ